MLLDVVRQTEVWVSQAAKRAIELETARQHPLEAGGVLTGYRDGDAIVVTHAIVVPDATHRRHVYVRDDVGANELLRQFIADRDPDDPTGYVGEWHSHPAPIGPSNVDASTLRELALLAQGPIALLVCMSTPAPVLVALVARRRTRAQARAVVTSAVVTTPSAEKASAVQFTFPKD
ncbi:Mov34/MPN/PAD-1 family protein [Isoptericola dokdonensis]|uniref:Mov34/MPN/PAD-1 family protein n=1 Tax=Isoptericola dokdonensis TaxID=372663 RepID=UPI00083733D7|nr:Mov34/MPN/PAD-1 family protein [Isoptericola dokdonensis]